MPKRKNSKAICFNMDEKLTERLDNYRLRHLRPFEDRTKFIEKSVSLRLKMLEGSGKR